MFSLLAPEAVVFLDSTNTGLLIVRWARVLHASSCVGCVDSTNTGASGTGVICASNCVGCACVLLCVLLCRVLISASIAGVVISSSCVGCVGALLCCLLSVGGLLTDGLVGDEVLGSCVRVFFFNFLDGGMEQWGRHGNCGGS